MKTSTTNLKPVHQAPATGRSKPSRISRSQHMLALAYIAHLDREIAKARQVELSTQN